MTESWHTDNSAKPDSITEPFDQQQLLAILNAFPQVRHWHLALSGGADSVALLNAVHALRAHINARISAIHVNHGLQPEAQQWAEFCRSLCQQLEIPFSLETLNIKKSPGQSLEALAREERYAVLQKHIQTYHALLTAHHRDDQAETLLLNLMRGSGPAGLAAMPLSRSFGKGLLVRPLLNTNQQQLIHYLQSRKISWINDCSNSDERFDRNYLRHQIMPLLEKRWPSAAESLATAAALQAEQLDLNSSIADSDLRQVMEFDSAAMCIDTLLQLSIPRQRNVIRNWLLSQLPPAQVSRNLLETIDRDFIAAAQDAQPQKILGNKTLYRYQHKLYLISVNAEDKTVKPQNWRLTVDFYSSELGLNLSRQTILNQFPQLTEKDELTVAFRRGGERFRIHPQQQSKSIKKLFQQWQIPPWQRSCIPLIYLGEQLIVVWGFATASEIWFNLAPVHKRTSAGSDSDAQSSNPNI